MTSADRLPVTSTPENSFPSSVPQPLPSQPPPQPPPVPLPPQQQRLHHGHEVTKSSMLQRGWLLVTSFVGRLMLVLAMGLFIGWEFPAALTERGTAAIDPRWTTAAILWLMSVSVPTHSHGPVTSSIIGIAWGTALNLGVLPILAWTLAQTQIRPDFAVGLILCAAVPSTLATAAVLTRQAGGNDAVALAITLVTNTLGLVSTPIWLYLLLGATVQWELSRLVVQLGLFVLVPTCAGLWLRRFSWVRSRMPYWRPVCSVTAQWLVLLIVLLAAVQAGRILQQQTTALPWLSLIWMGLSCLVLHLLALWLGYGIGRRLLLQRRVRVAAMISGSQKTLPIGLLLAADPAISELHLPMVTFPILAYHALQLVVDGALAKVLSRTAVSQPRQ
jgi:solute carrier family 10 (sodium/bile acid cotransporter), member 7